jgi:hypothetical protein
LSTAVHHQRKNPLGLQKEKVPGSPTVESFAAPFKALVPTLFDIFVVVDIQSECERANAARVWEVGSFKSGREYLGVIDEGCPKKRFGILVHITGFG